MAEIVNKVKKSKLQTIDLEKMVQAAVLDPFDLKDFLFEGLILKEKDFREKLENYNWDNHQDHYLTVFCSADAIIPTWAYMLVAKYAGSYVRDIFYGPQKKALNEMYKSILSNNDWSGYKDGFVILKGCSKLKLTPEVYMHATKLLMPHVKKIMYGEACSNVPVYRG